MLGPVDYVIGDSKKVHREDLTLRNTEGNKLVCSHFKPVLEEGRSNDKIPCVIYLHGNQSSRTEALPIVNLLLPMDISVFCFDFSGCGMSEGEWVAQWAQ